MQFAEGTIIQSCSWCPYGWIR